MHAPCIWLLLTNIFVTVQLKNLFLTGINFHFFKEILTSLEIKILGEMNCSPFNLSPASSLSSASVLLATMLMKWLWMTLCIDVDQILSCCVFLQSNTSLQEEVQRSGSAGSLQTESVSHKRSKSRNLQQNYGANFMYNMPNRDIKVWCFMYNSEPFKRYMLFFYRILHECEISV